MGQFSCVKYNQSVLLCKQLKGQVLHVGIGTHAQGLNEKYKFCEKKTVLLQSYGRRRKHKPQAVYSR